MKVYLKLIFSSILGLFLPLCTFAESPLIQRSGVDRLEFGSSYLRQAPLNQFSAEGRFVYSRSFKLIDSFDLVGEIPMGGIILRDKGGTLDFAPEVKLNAGVYYNKLGLSIMGTYGVGFLLLNDQLFVQYGAIAKKTLPFRFANIYEAGAELVKLNTSAEISKYTLLVIWRI